jgi:hypothetical protein
MHSSSSSNGGAAASMPRRSLIGGGRLGSMLRRRPANPQALLSEPLDQCWLAYKPLSRPDRQLLQQMVQPQASGGQGRGGQHCNSR